MEIIFNKTTEGEQGYSFSLVPVMVISKEYSGDKMYYELITGIFVWYMIFTWGASNTKPINK